MVIPEDVEKILALKLRTNRSADFLGWHYNKTGLYTVKSAYWLATHLEGLQRNPPNGNIALKQKIWKLTTTPKLKHFLWKLSSGILPTGENLQRRHISNQGIYKRCCQDAETSKHLFFDCQYAQALWRASGIPNYGIFTSNSSLEEKLDRIFNCNSNTKLGQHRFLPLWILWRLWKSRNILTFQRKQQSWRHALRLAKDDVIEWMNTEAYLTTFINSPQGAERTTTQQHTNWERPRVQWIKCNYDASFINTSIPPQAGWIYRDDQGIYKGACQAKGPKVNSALESECQALIQAMQHSWTKGYKKIIFEGDCQSLHNILHGKVLDFNSHNWICDIKMWSLKFDEVIFRWQGRIQNKAADCLAKTTLSENIHFVYHPFIPHHLTDILHSDYCNVTLSQLIKYIRCFKKKKILDY